MEGSDHFSLYTEHILDSRRKNTCKETHPELRTICQLTLATDQTKARPFLVIRMSPALPKPYQMHYPSIDVKKRSLVLITDEFSPPGNGPLHE